MKDAPGLQLAREATIIWNPTHPARLPERDEVT